MIITNSEKAFMGGLVAFLSATIIQLQQAGQFTASQLYWSVGAYLATHLAVWLTTNTPKAPVVPEVPVVTPPTV